MLYTPWESTAPHAELASASATFTLQHATRANKAMDALGGADERPQDKKHTRSPQPVARTSSGWARAHLASAADPVPVGKGAALDGLRERGRGSVVDTGGQPHSLTFDQGLSVPLFEFAFFLPHHTTRPGRLGRLRSQITTPDQCLAHRPPGRARPPNGFACVSLCISVRRGVPPARVNARKERLSGGRTDSARAIERSHLTHHSRSALPEPTRLRPSIPPDCPAERSTAALPTPSGTLEQMGRASRRGQLAPLVRQSHRRLRGEMRGGGPPERAHPAPDRSGPDAGNL